VLRAKPRIQPREEKFRCPPLLGHDQTVTMSPTRDGIATSRRSPSLPSWHFSSFALGIHIPCRREGRPSSLQTRRTPAPYCPWELEGNAHAIVDAGRPSPCGCELRRGARRCGACRKLIQGRPGTARGPQGSRGAKQGGLAVKLPPCQTRARNARVHLASMCTSAARRCLWCACAARVLS